MAMFSFVVPLESLDSRDDSQGLASVGFPELVLAHHWVVYLLGLLSVPCAEVVQLLASTYAR